MSHDPELRAHQEWLGYLQPVGLVASPAALRDAQAHVNKNIIREQSILIQHVRGDSAELTKRGEEPEARLKDFPAFARDFWQWEPTDLAGGPGGQELPAALEVPLPEYGEVLTPTYAVPDPANSGSWRMLIEARADNAALDEAPEDAPQEKRWQASPQARFERLLRANQVPIGLLVTPHAIRLVYAPRGESTGHLTFPFQAMCEVAGRPIVAALHLLLDAGRLFFLPTNQRLPWILLQSRKYQNDVSTKLAEQVLRALNELMRGFQAANEARKGELLREVLERAPEDVYGGLLTTLLRMVFILYAEDRGLLSNDPVYVGSYSLSGLFERLREDDAQYPDTMDQRYGAWAQFLTLCRVVYDGGGHGAMNLPPRHGRLFDPDAYSFLEGRAFRSKRSSEETVAPPRVSDGVMFRILQDLLMLDGDRLSYRSLDVEQIGSVYEAMMGFEVRAASGTSVGLRPDHVVVNLTDLLGRAGADRSKALKEEAGCDLTGKAQEELRSATTVEEIVSTLGRRVSPLYLDQRGMPQLVAVGGIYLEPTEERRRSGSHYTPRSLTEPIVRTTLEPILRQLGDKPRPDQILDLKICDPAMGSGAFLVEVCRFLAEALVEAWSIHGDGPVIPSDQESILHARRLVSQRCLYGVDKNPFAVDLAKLSLWLATLAKDHPFTFLDQSLRSGDSLVGLTRYQIAAFSWLPAGQRTFLDQELRRRIERVSEFRQRILAARDEVPYEQLRQQLDRAEDALVPLRQAGNVVLGAFFGAEKAQKREERRRELQFHVESAFKLPGIPEHEVAIENAIRCLGVHRLLPFHWEIEFPEVFERKNLGFDAIVGNPPFLSGTRIWPVLGSAYCDFLRLLHDDSGGKAVDLIAHFFRRSFTLIRNDGTIGLVATNTVCQGDTRDAGLKYICLHAGFIYAATRRLPWPGSAAVIVSVVHIKKGKPANLAVLDKNTVPGINSYLFANAREFDPVRLRCNAQLSFQGSIILGMGFTFDDMEKKGIASPIAEMLRLIEKDPRNAERISPYIGGKELTTSPQHSYHRHVINFADLSLQEASHWPDLLEIVRKRVKPERDKLGGYAIANRRREYWWQFGTYTPSLYKVAGKLRQLLALSSVGQYCAFAFLPPNLIYSHSLYLFALDDWQDFCLLQSRPHEIWARFFGSSLEDRLRYTPSDCFETFAFPENWGSGHFALETAGRSYYEFRARLMVQNDEGLTITYNRFHDPEERHPEIVTLRKLHAEMDRAVLAAYGWSDIKTDCEFLLEYEIDEENWGDKKQPWRYRWPDHVRDDVLARLLELNRRYAERERLTGSAAENSQPKKRAPRAKNKDAAAVAPTLFSAEELTK